MSNLLLGLSLGFAAGVSPGPMLALVIARSMEKGFASGLRVAIAPLFSDLPIVLSAVLLATALPPRLLQALGIGGGLFLIFLGVQEIVRARRVTLGHPGEKRTEDLTHAILVNLLNPHPWVFWFSVGGPLVVRAWALSPIDGSSFLVVVLRASCRQQDHACVADRPEPQSASARVVPLGRSDLRRDADRRRRLLVWQA